MLVATVQTQKKTFHIAENHSVLEEKPIILKERHHKNEQLCHSSWPFMLQELERTIEAEE